MRAIELAKGHLYDQKSAYVLCRLALTLPGTDGWCDPVKPWVMKVQTGRQKACHVLFFINSGRNIGPDKLLACQAVRQMAADLQWHLIQDAAQKRRQDTTQAGAWAGTLVFTDQGIVRGVLQSGKMGKCKKLHAISFDCGSL
jgi:hypothetical protein